MHEETDEENCTAPVRRFDGDFTSRAWIVFSKAVTEELPERDQYTALKVAVMVSTQHLLSAFVAVDGPRYSRSSVSPSV